jgi:hypothetical protein
MAGQWQLVPADGVPFGGATFPSMAAAAPPSVIILQTPQPTDGSQYGNGSGYRGARRGERGGRGVGWPHPNRNYNQATRDGGRGGRGGGRKCRVAGRGAAAGQQQQQRAPAGRVPQERMRNIIAVDGGMKALCAAFAQDEGGCTRGNQCNFSHASKVERFCLSFFEYQERGVESGCNRGDACLFAHGIGSRPIYLAFKANQAALEAQEDGNAMQGRPTGPTQQTVQSEIIEITVLN